MVFWGVEVKPGEKFSPSGVEDGEYEGSRLHLSQATLGLDGKGKERTVVKCQVGHGQELLLCSLTPGVSESCSLDLLFDQDVVFSVAGSTSVHLVGYYMPLDDEEEDVDYEFEGSEFDSEDDSDDVDYDTDMDDEDAPPSSVTLTELDDAGNPVTLEATPVVNKKPAADSDQEHKTSTKKRKRAAAAKEKADALKEEKKESLPEADNVVTVAEVSEDEDGFPVPSEQTEAPNKSEGISTPVTPSSESKKQKKKKKNKKEKEEKVPVQVEGEEKTPRKTEKTPKKATKENGSEVKVSITTPATKGSTVSPGGKDASAMKAKKAGFGIRKFPNGLELEEIAMGKPDARQTKPGKRVSVHYTGKLKSSGKVFDTSIGKKPFAFRLGVGEVVKGWDVGLAGMRIGDKRRITVPPAMGYGAKGMGPIPGNAWLVFDVEVVDAAK